MSISLHSQEVTVDRFKLLDTLKHNRDIHISEYAEALINYRKSLQIDLSDAIMEARDESVDLSKIRVQFNVPQSHVAEYDNIIEMLEMSVHKDISLDNTAFKAYVKDDWAWKQGFSLLNSTYATKAASF